MIASAAENLEFDLPPKGPKTVNGQSAEALKGHIERIENLVEKKEGISEDIKLRKQEAKAEGFDVKTINSILKLRKKDASTVEEEELLLAAYKIALGMTND
jgi:uncharacterized protein (UPF0335 family)